ncbi:MAG: DUF2851 family protein, partial [Rhodothermales bacterium]|nr:DUF2851 family protein [Rhodothermales bacterium]
MVGTTRNGKRYTSVPQGVFPENEITLGGNRMHLRQLLKRLPPPLKSLSLTATRGDYEPADQSRTILHEPGLEEQRFPERFVQDIWASRLFDPSRLTTTDGLNVSVLSPGEQNHDSGPDFLGARIRIGDLDWRGDVEIHFRSSDWLAHQHQFDARYNSVILHVSFLADFWTGKLHRPDGSSMAEVVLRPCLALPLRRLLVALSAQGNEKLPCASEWSKVPEELKKGWVHKLSRENLNEKKSRFAALLPAAGSLDELLYRELMRGMGYSKNSETFHELACRVPLAVLRASRDVNFHEAVLFGVSGLTATGVSPRDHKGASTRRSVLREQFEQVNVRLGIPEMSPLSWRFFRLRPTNFPTLRIAQATGWFSDDGLLAGPAIPRMLTAMLAGEPRNSLRSLLAMTPSDYWTTHYRFGKHSTAATRRIGVSRIDTLITNVVLP